MFKDMIYAAADLSRRAAEPNQPPAAAMQLAQAALNVANATVAIAAGGDGALARAVFKAERPAD